MPDQTQTALPAPPSIPPSNASYNKIADRLYKAAQAGNPVAVVYTRDTVKGSNTYCKMLRRYGDELLAAIAVPEPTPTPVKKAKAKLPETITFDQWAESGGTAGIFAKAVKSGKVKIEPAAGKKVTA